MFSISEIRKARDFLLEKKAANKIHYSHDSKGLDIKKLFEQDGYTQGYV
jgi:hypothetical protein